MFEIAFYIDETGKSPFRSWYDTLDYQAKTKITAAVERLEKGNTSNVKLLGEGILEYKLTFGPGYRLYFAREGEKMIILLIGGTKKRQNKDIVNAKLFWRAYKTERDGEKNAIR